MRRILCVLVCILLLSSLTFADNDEALEGQLSTFRYSHGLDESNFALSYFNLDSGDRYDFNAQAFFPIGKVWTLPLHMYYCSQEYHGAFLPAFDDPNYNNPEYEFTINELTLDRCRTESILSGNEEINQAMLDRVNQYKSVINEEFGRIKEEDLPENYFTANDYSTEFLINCMIELDSTSEIYGDLTQLYDLAQTPDAYNSGGCSHKIIQIRGEENGMICAVAKIFTAQPYLIACIVSKDAGGDEVLAEVNSLICTYVESLDESKDSVQNAQTGLERSDSSYLVTTQNPNDTPVLKWIGIALGAALALALLIFLIYKTSMKIIYRNRE